MQQSIVALLTLVFEHLTSSVQGLRGILITGIGGAFKMEKIVSLEFMRKYIHVAKIVKPVLTSEAANYIAEQYSNLRNQDQMSSDIARTSPVTARTLETLIRLSTAHAKARMSKTIDMQDSEAAAELVQFAYFKKVLEKEKKRRKEESDVETEEEEVIQDDGDSKKRRKSQTKDGESRKRRRELKEGEQHDPYDFSDAEGETPD
eukprot:g45756.t1